MRRSKHGRCVDRWPSAVLIRSIVVAQSAVAGAALSPPRAPCRRPRDASGAAAGRPLDGRRHRHADRARVADERRHRRRAWSRRRTSCSINGKMPGTISMFVWDRAGALRRYEVVVQRDLARLTEQMKQLFPGETIDVAEQRQERRARPASVTNKDIDREGRRTSPPATSTRRTTSSPCCSCRTARRATRCCCACGSPK